MVDLNPGMVPEFAFHRPFNLGDSVWIRQDTDVIEESHQRLCWLQTFLHSLKGLVLTHGEQGRHQRVALLPAFTLLDFVAVPSSSSHKCVEGCP